MEMKLDNLIKKIKEEGVEEAKAEAGRIAEEAKKKADDIVRDAEKTKEALIKEGQREARDLIKGGEETLRQASRDVLLSLRQSIIELFNKVLRKEVSDELSAENLKKIIVKVIENFKKDQRLDIELLLSKEDKKSLEDVLLASLKDEIRKGVTFKAAPNIEKGFRIGEKDKKFYYDFTDEAIIEAFKQYLNPKIAEILGIHKNE